MSYQGDDENVHAMHHWMLVYVPADLEHSLSEIYEELIGVMERALSSNDPQSFAEELFALQQQRLEILDEVYRRPLPDYCQGRPVEHTSMEILREFLKIASRRLNARDILAVGRVETPWHPLEPEAPYVAIYDTQEHCVIHFSGDNSLTEYEYRDPKVPNEPSMVRYFTTDIGMDHTAWGEDGVYPAYLQWITEYRTLENGTRQYRSFTGFGTLSNDWFS